MRKICIDFDTVLDSGQFDLRYDGSLANVPRLGSMEWLSSLGKYKVYIFGERSRTFTGRSHMRTWLFESMLDICLQECKPGISSWHNRIVKGMNSQSGFDVHIYKSVKKWVKTIVMPTKFPNCMYFSRKSLSFISEFPALSDLDNAYSYSEMYASPKEGR